MEVYDCPGLWDLLVGGALELVEAFHGYLLDPPTPGLVTGSEPGLVGLFLERLGSAYRSRAGPLRSRAGIVNSENLDAVEAVRVASDGLLGSGQDRLVGGVPGDSQGGRDM